MWTHAIDSVALKRIHSALNKVKHQAFLLTWAWLSRSAPYKDVNKQMQATTQRASNLLSSRLVSANLSIIKSYPPWRFSRALISANSLRKSVIEGSPSARRSAAFSFSMTLTTMPITIFKKANVVRNIKLKKNTHA